MEYDVKNIAESIKDMAEKLAEVGIVEWALEVNNKDKYECNLIIFKEDAEEIDIRNIEEIVKEIEKKLNISVLSVKIDFNMEGIVLLIDEEK